MVKGQADFAQSVRSRREVKAILRKKAKQSVCTGTKKKYTYQRGVMKRFLDKGGGR